jgi:SNF2 family DNA or RNA helicase
MMDVKTITVHARFVPLNGVFVWAKDENDHPIDPVELNTRLFSWHEASFYGTFLEIDEIDEVQGTLLSPGVALDYFIDPSPLQHQTLQWSVEAEEVLAAAQIISKAIHDETLLPNFAKWQQGIESWRVPSVPSATLDFIPKWVEMILDKELDVLPSKIATRIKGTRKHPLMKAELRLREHWTEEEWLATIGWKEDIIPFTVAVQLMEPKGASNWKLRLVLQDREDNTIQFVYPTDEPLFPQYWRNSLARVEQELLKIGRILPDLVGKDDLPHFPMSLDDEEAWRFLTEQSIQLVENGCSVQLPSWWARIEQRKPKLYARIQSPAKESTLGIKQLMSFNWKLSIDGHDMTDAQFEEIIKQKKKLIQLDGKWIQLDAEHLNQLQRIIQKVKKQKGLTLGQVLQTYFLQESEDQEFEGEIGVELNNNLIEMLNGLQELHTLHPIEHPQGLQGELRPYQAEGVAWLWFLRQFGLGGCLADDMGLGKTVQWIAYLLQVKEVEQPETPSLLICPTSVLGNWQKELSRFAPSFDIYVHYGPKRLKGEEFNQAVQGKDVVLTTYALSHLDREELQTVEWSSIGLDEAQNIKNARTKQAVAIRGLTGCHRVALTGTPIENRLTELWSLFDFINPGYLSSLHDFSGRFIHPIEKNGDIRLIKQVQQITRPFLLRRMKTDPAIELNLPEKSEFKEYLPLTTEQATMYESILQDLFEEVDNRPAMERRGLILASLTKLKQVCDHPDLPLADHENRKWKGRSPKIERLLEMVEELRENGDKCLIFTQYVKMGQMLQQIIQKERKEPVLFLHGVVPKAKRDEMIEQFQKDCPIFILSLKAGGTGLNLTAANHVFHIDRWWNPAVENQATDRAYRIGQFRKVLVHKFITLGTLEERIDEMIEQKKDLSEQIIGSGEQWITELNPNELKDLLALRKEWISS